MVLFEKCLILDNQFICIMITTRLRAYLSCLALFFCTDPFFVNAQATAGVKTENGLISGASKEGISVFKGVPFAAPPVGDLRWKAPVPAHNWKGIRRCDVFSASAMQTKPVPFMMYTEEYLAPQEPLSEDCLYLNVWTGAKAATAKLPVIVFIHGGGFVSGAGSCPIYEGTEIAKKGVVFVTINYRLGVFGFLAHPELTKESGTHSSGNYAFLDQIAALKWVKRNIAAFGGDAGKVTIMGQSAGAFSVNALAASPLAKGLFRGVIAESGGMFNNDRNKPLITAENEGKGLAEKLKTPAIAEMRKIPAGEILTAAKGMNFTPVVDGYVLPQRVYDLFKAGKQNDVALLTGWNTGDNFLAGKPLTSADYKAKVNHDYGELAAEFLKLYPGETDGEAATSQKDFARNQFAEWQTHTWASFQNKLGHHQSYIYWFSHIPPYQTEAQNFGAFHSAEIVFALNDLNTWNRPWKDVDRKLADKISSYWVNFARTGNPNGAGLPDWLAYNKQTGDIMQFNNIPILKHGLLKEKLALSDAIYERQNSDKK